MKTRISKIARLPKIIRDQLNQKIEDGCLGIEITKWLNSLPEVAKIMADHFGGRLITNQNVSEWRRTGYADWQLSREGRQHWWEIIETGRELNQARHPEDGADASGHLATILLAELGMALEELHRMEDSRERWKFFRQLSLALSRLRNDDTREKRFQLTEARQLRGRNLILSNPAYSCQKK
jgi:hypothetical protein